eukprot:CAMPEP_0185160180 /NCGR_PEP_ID=MMETSP1139-20130426/3488_1 /TAXON_ID=298111 /ORGANISM="Pavlova sp., Strain CCMP459" /LENGTH=172 /DNA_ID=CAMNT_0027725377 /DNA_START=72 /DNA_END=591 /DNA_ORIENTATION=-
MQTSSGVPDKDGDSRVRVRARNTWGAPPPGSATGANRARVLPLRLTAIKWASRDSERLGRGASEVAAITVSGHDSSGGRLPMSRSSKGKSSSSESGSSSQSACIPVKSDPGNCPVYASSSSSAHLVQSALTNFLYDLSARSTSHQSGSPLERMTCTHLSLANHLESAGDTAL